MCQRESDDFAGAGEEEDFFDLEDGRAGRGDVVDDDYIFSAHERGLGKLKGGFSIL